MGSSPTWGPSGHELVHNGSVAKSCPWLLVLTTELMFFPQPAHLECVQVTSPEPEGRCWCPAASALERCVLLVMQHWKDILFCHPSFPFRCEELQILLGVSRQVSLHKWSDCQWKSQAICSRVFRMLTNAHWEHGCHHHLILQRPWTAVR